MPSFKCADIGFPEDPFEIKTATKDELMKLVAEHARFVHGMKTVPADLQEAIKKAIKK